MLTDSAGGHPARRRLAPGYWEQNLGLDPRNTQWLANAADTYAMFRQFPAALKNYDRLLDLVPNDPDTIASETVIHQAEGNLEQAGKLLPGVNAQTPSFHAFLAKMDQLFLQRQFDEEHPQWDPLRGDPRFRKLYEEKKP